MEEGSKQSKLDVTEQDVYEAMKDIPGYLDITPGDFKELYKVALKVAVERIERSIMAHDVMTADVIFVHPDAPLKDVAELMATSTVSGVSVVDGDNRPVGVISEKDFLYHMGRTRSGNFMLIIAECLRGKGCLALPIREQKAADIMSAPALSVTPDSTVHEIAELFVANNINRVPVIDAEGVLCGIVSRADVVRSAGIMKQA